MKATVPISNVIDLLKCLEKKSICTTSLLEELGHSKIEIDSATEFSAYQYSLLYQKAMMLMKDESFGILSGGKMPNGAFKMMCLSILHAKTLSHALHRCSEFYEICKGPKIKPVLIRKGQSALVTFSMLNGEKEDINDLLANESIGQIRNTLSMWHHFISWLIGRRLILKAAYFSSSQPENTSDYKALFQSEVKFDQHANSIVFSASYLDMPIIQTENSLKDFIKTAPYQLLVMVENDNSLKSQIIAIIGKDFSRQIPSAEEVASTLYMSISTLRRRLHAEHTSYQQIKDECRKEAALNYISSPQLTLNDIATLLGFDEPSAFFRSFKKWVGMTPSEYRNHLNDDT
ncbi:AraC family transcriptional regulator [Marinomonas sp. C2222]|uniref:AraC family transcriptional regulator n=1 Tax=Marinomonas sargassi TaxID=2984494 RepID=A0ABT2YSR9_9GAMM|nr:AraC family transcriptional regulator [Marinomonas sargassi]MCV2402800.1 AraC family transcriptional regulator [Marinomonas sargassi]